MLTQAEDLVTVRNALHHFTPQTHTSGAPETNATFERLKGLALNPWASHNNAIFPDRLLCHACAAWGVETSIAFVTEFSDKVGIARAHERLPCNPSPRA